MFDNLPPLVFADENEERRWINDLHLTRRLELVQLTAAALQGLLANGNSTNDAGTVVRAIAIARMAQAEI
jgi:hypothetical protein